MIKCIIINITNYWIILLEISKKKLFLLSFLLSLLSAILPSLLMQRQTKEPKIAFNYTSQFVKKVNFNDVIDFTNYDTEIITNQLYFLNFNYTPSLTNILNNDLIFFWIHREIFGRVDNLSFYGSRRLIWFQFLCRKNCDFLLVFDH